MWTFSCPEIVFGEDALSRLDFITGKKAFIVTDANMVDLGFVAQVQERLQTAGLESELFTEVEPDPALETVIRCQQQMLASEPDWIIGLGGGSPLDAAKAAWFLYERPQVDPAAINPFEIFEPATKARLIAIPTTSGTGADISMGVVLTDKTEQRKLTLIARELQPTIAIVDPVFTVKMPPQTTADTGLDVLTHAVEAYTNPWGNPFTDGMALKALDLVFDYLPRAYASGADMEAREAMHNAASIAGIAFSNAALALAHSLAHALGGVFHTIHGRTVGMFLPYTIQFAANAGGSRYAEIARFLQLPAGSEEIAAGSLVQHIRQLQKAIEQPLSISETGIAQEKLVEAMPFLLTNAMSDPQTVTTPRPPEEAELERLFLYAYEGKTVDF